MLDLLLFNLRGHKVLVLLLLDELVVLLFSERLVCVDWGLETMGDAVGEL